MKPCCPTLNETCRLNVAALFVSGFLTTDKATSLLMVALIHQQIAQLPLIALHHPLVRVG